jgi:ABC-type branched-subunit amino acid transport system substrate-binding protein
LLKNDKEAAVTGSLKVRWTAAVMVAAIALACTGSSSGGGSRAAVQFAYISDMTGPSAAQSAPHLSGFKTYIDWTNGEGGVNGHRILLNVTDDGADTNRAKVAIQTAQAENALGIFGGLESNVWGPVAPLAAQTKILQFTVGVTDNYVIPPQPYLYSMQLGQLQYALSEVRFIQKYLIPNKLVPANPTIGIFRYTSAASQELALAIRAEAAKLSYRVIAEETFAPLATDVSSQASSIAQKNPDVLLGALLDVNAPLVMRSLREKGWKGPWVGHGGASGESTFRALNDPLYFSNRAYVLPGTPELPAAVEMQTRARSTNNTAGIDVPTFVQGYLVGWFAVEALKRCKDPCDSVKYNTAMESVGKIDTKGINADVAITPERHRAPGATIVWRWDAAKGRTVAAGDWVTTV